jgi:hypothetical protein
MARQTKHRWYRTGAVAAATASLLVLGVAPANATEDATQVRQYLANTLAASTRPASLAQGKSAERVQRFMDEAARSGRLVDIARVRIATVNDPDAGQIDMVWDDLGDAQYLGVTNLAQPGVGVQTGVGFAFTEPTTPSPATPGAGGFGYEGGYSVTGMYQYNGGCRTVYFDPAYWSTQDHWTTTCYQKFAKAGTNKWIYNRWALFNRAKPESGVRGEIRDMTIRSRPWKGYESRVVGLDTWTPAVGSSNCTETVQFKFEYSGASITIPIHRCSTTKVLPEANIHSMGMDFDGRTSNQLYEDFGMAFRASTTAAIPIMADYFWAEVQYCEDYGVGCGGYAASQYLKLTDAGW